MLDAKLVDKKGKDCYTFRYEEDRSEGHFLHANIRYVKVTEESDRDFFFDDIGEGEETKIRWFDSEAYQLLYNDLLSGEASSDLSADDIYVMRPEYAAYDHQKFPGRLEAMRNIVGALNERAKEDQDAFDNFVLNHEVSTRSRTGHIHWPGSEAQKISRDDIKKGKFAGAGAYRRMYNQREEYNQHFDFDIFCDRIRQEIKTGKYYHTLKIKGKQHKAS